MCRHLHHLRGLRFLRTHPNLSPVLKYHHCHYRGRRSRQTHPSRDLVLRRYRCHQLGRASLKRIQTSLYPQMNQFLDLNLERGRKHHLQACHSLRIRPSLDLLQRLHRHPVRRHRRYQFCRQCYQAHQLRCSYPSLGPKLLAIDQVCLPMT